MRQRPPVQKGGGDHQEVREDAGLEKEEEEKKISFFPFLREDLFLRTEKEHTLYSTLQHHIRQVAASRCQTNKKEILSRRRRR